MQAEFWLDLWRRGQIGFHQPTVSRYLSRFWSVPAENPGTTVFVPLCGKSRDLVWLRDRGHAVTGVELSDLALESFCMENGIPARRRQSERFDVYEAPALKLYCGDFFDLSAEQTGSFGAMYDRAALVSFGPDLRPAYARRITSLTSTGTVTLLVTLEYPQEQRAGPPFSVSPAEVHELYGEHHKIEELFRQDILADEPRMRARGVRSLHEVCYRLTRS